jgi:hypothetical protein
MNFSRVHVLYNEIGILKLEESQRISDIRRGRLDRSRFSVSSGAAEQGFESRLKLNCRMFLFSNMSWTIEC